MKTMQIQICYTLFQVFSSFFYRTLAQCSPHRIVGLYSIFEMLLCRQRFRHIAVNVPAAWRSGGFH